MSIAMGRGSIERAVMMETTNSIEGVDKVNGSLRRRLLGIAAAGSSCLGVLSAGVLVRIRRMRWTATDVFPSGRTLISELVSALLEVSGGGGHGFVGSRRLEGFRCGCVWEGDQQVGMTGC